MGAFTVFDGFGQPRYSHVASLGRHSAMNFKEGDLVRPLDWAWENEETDGVKLRVELVTSKAVVGVDIETGVYWFGNRGQFEALPSPSLNENRKLVPRRRRYFDALWTSHTWRLLCLCASLCLGSAQRLFKPFRSRYKD